MHMWFIPILALYIFLNWLIGRQLYELLKINAVVFVACFAVLAFSPLLSRLGPFGFLDKVGNYWLVFFYYATFAALLGVFIKHKPVVLGFYVLIIVVIWAGAVNAQKVHVVDYDIVIPGRAGSLHAVLLADTHINRTKGDHYVQQIVADINKLNPDIVFWVGDIFDDRDIHVLDRQKEALKGIKARYGVFGVVGNHEYYNRNLSASLKIYEAAGIKILIDEVVELEDFYIAGRDDVHNKRRGLDQLLQGVDKSKPLILLDHQPVDLEEALSHGVDLQLSGHTHKGQFFPNQLFTSRLFEVDHGYLDKGGLQVIVTSGYSTWGPPVRIGSRSEIVALHIKFKT